MKHMTTESFVVSRRNIIISNLVMMLLLVPIVGWIMSKGQEPGFVRVFIPILAGMMAIMAVEMLVITYFLLKKIRKIGYDIGEEGVSKLNKFGEPADLLAYSDMKAVKIKSLTTGEVKVIRLKSNKKSAMMIGLDDMNGIAEKLEDFVAEDRLIHKEGKIDWYSFKTNLVTIAIVMPVMIVFVMFGRGLAGYVSQLILMVFGGYFLLFKPLTKYYGKKFRIAEVILALIIIVTQGINMVISLVV